MEVLMMTTSSPHISDSSLQNLEAFLQANMVIVSISMRAHIKFKFAHFCANNTRSRPFTMVCFFTYRHCPLSFHSTGHLKASRLRAMREST
jgi:uncharacterized protein YcsI (UPF0317 family)